MKLVHLMTTNASIFNHKSLFLKLRIISLRHHNHMLVYNIKSQQNKLKILDLT